MEPSRAIAGVGRVILWSGESLWIGRDAGRVQPHAHHAIQISVALSGCVRLRGEDASEWMQCHAAIVMPHRRHEFDGGGQSVAQIFVEPETNQGRALVQRFAGKSISSVEIDDVRPVGAALRAAYLENADDSVLIAASSALVAHLCDSHQGKAGVDPRITRAIEVVRSRLNEAVTLADAARAAHLSPSRFRHLFVAQTGISFRAYLLWARVATAIGTGMRGTSWTQAAQDCGFADSAHLSRTCRRMFGIAPSMLVRE